MSIPGAARSAFQEPQRPYPQPWRGQGAPKSLQKAPRATSKKHLNSQLKVGNNILFCDRDNSLCGLKDYFNYLNNSKIAISVRGGEYSNTRNIEGPYLGCALFTQKLEIEIVNDYVDNHSAIFFDETNLIKKLTEYINDQDKLKSLCENSRNHCLQYHTTESRASYYLNKIKNIKNW